MKKAHSLRNAPVNGVLLRAKTFVWALRRNTLLRGFTPAKLEYESIRAKQSGGGENRTRVLG